MWAGESEGERKRERERERERETERQAQRWRDGETVWHDAAPLLQNYYTSF